MRTYDPITLAEVKRAIAMREQDLQWHDIAARLGRKKNNLQAAVHLHRTGRWKGSHDRRASAISAMEGLIESLGIVTVPPLARAVGLKVDSARRLLLRNGLDREMRDELAGRKRKAA